MKVIKVNEKHLKGKLNIVSYGAGQNSTAMIIWMKNNNVPIDEIIFANPGNEMPETYKFIEEFKKWCKKNNLKFTTVKSHLGTLKDWYYSKKKIPVRMFRSCTDLFKIRPIYKYIKKEYGKVHMNMYLGIDVGEKHRAKESGREDRTMLYPLIDNNINRKGCVEIIKKEGLSIPVKSGCYFCPFQNKGSWLTLLEKYPKLYDDTIKFEENGSGFPRFYLGRIPLRKFKKITKSQLKLDKFIDNEVEVEQCVYCHL